MYKAIRYIGSKQKVLPFLEEKLFSLLKKDAVDNTEQNHFSFKFFDGFVGSGIVAQYLAEKYPSSTVCGADISNYSKSLFSILNLAVAFKSSTEVLAIWDKYWSLPQTQQKIKGPFYEEFSPLGKPVSFKEPRNFFHSEVAQTIDGLKEFLKQQCASGALTDNQVQVLLFFVLAYACKAANTTSVFGAFLKSPPKDTVFNKAYVEKILKELVDIEQRTAHSTFYSGDIVKSLKAAPAQDLIYLDPPYSTRRYESNYHILNFVVDIGFTGSDIKVGSKTAQPEHMLPNLFGQKKQTEVVFRDMLDAALEKSSIVGVSYNTDGVVQQAWLEDYCRTKNCRLTTHTLDYKRFKSKKESVNTTNLQEILWILQK